MPAKARPEKSTPYKSWVLKSILLLALVALFLGGVIWAGRWGKDTLQDNPRYEVDFIEIDCEPPVGMNRKAFLEQVRYYASPGLPERLHLLGANLKIRLADGFARHPWVEKVDDVAILAPKQIVVKLTYRTPVLAVQDGTKLRAVDGAGILLPDDAPTVGLPLYEGAAKAPKATGERWGDPNVEAAARKLKR
jgi:hypothetical protein